MNRKMILLGLLVILSVSLTSCKSQIIEEFDVYCKKCGYESATDAESILFMGKIECDNGPIIRTEPGSYNYDKWGNGVGRNERVNCCPDNEKEDGKCYDGKEVYR